jgi:hypothetical protein
VERSAVARLVCSEYRVYAVVIRLKAVLRTAIAG